VHASRRTHTHLTHSTHCSRLHTPTARYPGVRVPAHAVLQQFRPEDAVAAEDASSLTWEAMLAGVDPVAAAVLHVRTLDAYLNSAFNYEFEKEVVRWRGLFEREGLGDILTPQIVQTFHALYVYVPPTFLPPVPAGAAPPPPLLVKCANAAEASLLWALHARQMDSEYDMETFFRTILDAPVAPRVVLPERRDEGAHSGAFVFTL
jgi:hypothetical protein